VGIAAGVVVLVYAVWWGVLYTMQNKMLFPTDKLPMPVRQPRFPNTLVMQLKLDDGSTNEAWLIPGRGVTPQHPGPLVVYFHGNAELIDFQDQIVSEYTKRGISVLMPEYRGYGRSGGEPNLTNIEKDNEHFFDTVIKQPIIDPTHIVFHGRSIGGAVAGQLAITRRPAGLILESTFASMAQMAHDRAAPAFLITNPYVTDKVVAKLKCPILIMHGSADDLIPVEHGHMLQQANPNATYVEYDAGHNDFPGMNNLPDYWAQIDKLLKEVGIDPSIKPAPQKPIAADKAQTPAPAATEQPAKAPAAQPAPAQ
jgi:fermentation-respiration switch protein FrsA (DUF1100 family)